MSLRHWATGRQRQLPLPYALFLLERGALRSLCRQCEAAHPERHREDRAGARESEAHTAEAVGLAERRRKDRARGRAARVAAVPR